MANKTLTQCYQLQDQLFAAFESEKDNDIKSRLACAWDKITTKQRVIRGVPSLKPIDARVKLKNVVNASMLSIGDAPATDAEVVAPGVDPGQVAGAPAAVDPEPGGTV